MAQEARRGKRERERRGLDKDGCVAGEGRKCSEIRKKSVVKYIKVM